MNEDIRSIDKMKNFKHFVSENIDMKDLYKTMDYYIEDTDAYQSAFDRFLKEYPNSKDYEAQLNAIHYGIEEYVFTNGANLNYELVDSNDKPINLEKEYKIKNYNLK